MEAIVAVFVTSLVVASAALMYSLVSAEKTKSSSTTTNQGSARISKLSLKRLRKQKS